MIGNEFDDLFAEKMETLNIKDELYSRSVDDIDLFLRSIGRMIKFCAPAGQMKR